MPPFSSILLFLPAAFGLGALLGWALQSLLANKRIRKLEESWAARLRNKENELELTSSKLGSFVNALQTNYIASQATLRAYEASLVECQCQHADLEASLTARTAELDRIHEALSIEAQDWETKYHAVAQAKDAEIGRLQSRVRELEPFTVRAQEWETKFLLVIGNKDTQINKLQRQVRELERLRTQSKHWMFSVLLLERETATAKLTPFTFAR